MSLMLKLSTLALTATIALNASFNLDEYIRTVLIQNKSIKVNSVKLLDKIDVEGRADWKAYLFMMNLNIKGKNDNYPEALFVNEKDGIVVNSFYDLKKRRRITKDEFKPEMDTKLYYQDSHLIAGNKDAKHKLVVFSDPQCPFCIQTVPVIYEDVKKNPKDFALYYYHMPLLRLHPVSDVLTRVMEVLQKDGRVGDAMKMYSLKISYKERDEAKILSEIKKQFNIDIKKEEINKSEIKEVIKSDVEMATNIMLTGTPTIYLDGRYSKDRLAYKKLIKK